MRNGSDWKLTTQTFGAIEKQYGPLEVDLFASQLTNQCKTLLQLAARSIRGGNRCLPTGLVEGEGVCQPPMELNNSNSEPSSNSKGRANNYNPPLEVPTMVCLGTGNADRLAAPSTISAINIPVERVPVQFGECVQVSNCFSPQEGGWTQCGTIVRLVKGVFNCRPPVPKYCITWDV